MGILADPTTMSSYHSRCVLFFFTPEGGDVGLSDTTDADMICVRVEEIDSSVGSSVLVGRSALTVQI